MACDESGSEYCQDEVFLRDVFFKAYDDMNADFAQFVERAVVRDDLDLVPATQGGDVSAFEELVERYDRRLLRIAEHITHNREDSQDAVQETFLKAFQHVGEFREHSRFSTWLIRITVNQALMKLRKRRTTKEVSLDEDFQADGDMLPREVADWAPNRSGGRDPGPKSRRSEGAAMASSIAASRTAKRVLQHQRACSSSS